MKLTQRPVAAAAFFLTTIALSACKWTEECSQEVSQTTTLRADRTCPSAREEQARVDSELPPLGIKIHSEARTEVAIGARVVCWYRATEAEGIDICFLGTRETMLADATHPEPTPNESAGAWSTGYLLSCDAEGALYGQVILADAADPSTGLPTAPIDCPESVTPEPTASGKLTSVTTLVGSDEYPGRINCDYDATETSWCGFKELSH
jgi:hypothetical protein